MFTFITRHGPRCVRLCASGLCLFSVLATAGPAAAGEGDVLSSIDHRADEGWSRALDIWNWAEPGYREVKSAALLAKWMEDEGFRVQRGVAGMPTAFTAEFGEGHPIIAILGEYDALPGLSQAAVPARQPLIENGYGHGCGHHLFGVASALACLAVADRMKAGEFNGTIRYYGCPAEEGGSAKAFMVRDGLFADVDVALHWHPGSGNFAGDRSSLARIAVKFRFYGKSAHASGTPEQGRSALDAVELTSHASELLREHMPEEARLHHVITQGGGAPNIVPEFAEVYFYIRHPKAFTLRPLYDRLVKCAEAGALATETRLDVVNEGGIVELLPNTPLSAVLLRHLKELNALTYSAEEVEFATRLAETLPERQPLEKIHEVSDRSGVVGRGSTDVGDVSWATPTAGFTTACWAPGTPGHSWQAVACGATTIARQGMLLAARVLAASAVDLFRSPELIAAAKADFRHRLEGRAAPSLLLPDQKPPLDYRGIPAASTTE